MFKVCAQVVRYEEWLENARSQAKCLWPAKAVTLVRPCGTSMLATKHVPCAMGKPLDGFRGINVNPYPLRGGYMLRITDLRVSKSSDVTLARSDAPTT